jgi:hypothetical protein
MVQTAAILRDQAGNGPPVSDEKKTIFYAAHSPSSSMLRRSSTPALAEEQLERQSDLQVEFGHNLKPAVNSILQVYPKYIGFIV